MSYQIGFGSKKYDLKVEYIKGSFEPEVFLNNKRLYNHSSYIVGNDSFIYEPSFLDGKIINKELDTELKSKVKKLQEALNLVSKTNY